MNNKQKASLRISLLPIVILVGVILGVGYFLLKGEINLPKSDNTLTIQRIEGFPTVIYTDKVIEKQRRVIKNDQELTEFLNLIDETGLLTVKEQINFDKDMVLAVSTETNDETEHKLKIKKVYEDKKEKRLLVEVEETNPEEECQVEMDKNIAVDMVIVSKTDWEIKFEKITKAIQCDEKQEQEIDQSTESESKITN